MAVKVLIPPPLRPHAGGQAAAEFPAKNVAEALGQLTREFADLKRHLFTEDGRLRSFVNVYVNGEDIRYLAQEKTPTKDGDTINIIPSIAGGVVGRARLRGLRPKPPSPGFVGVPQARQDAVMEERSLGCARQKDGATEKAGPLRSG